MPSAPQLLKIIEEYSKKTDGKCGLRAAELSVQTGIPLPVVREELKNLYHQGKIIPREGLHQKLIFLNHNTQ
jgi:hypothetical protein